MVIKYLENRLYLLWGCWQYSPKTEDTEGDSGKKEMSLNVINLSNDVRLRMVTLMPVFRGADRPGYNEDYPQ